MARNESLLMLRGEKRVGMPIREFLLQNYPELGLLGCADKLGVSKGTCYYWCLKFGLKTQRSLVPINVEVK